MPGLPLVEAMRPHQWVKNLLVFAPLLFAHRLGDPASVRSAVVAFVSFCLVASATYLFNDVKDRDADRRHPVKRSRPVPSGRLSTTVATGAALVLAAAGAGVAWTVGGEPLPLVFWVAAYAILNLAYTLRLKHVAIVDALCIALGFQLRVHAGSVAIGVASSKWLLLCTFFFATFVAFCKRRDEIASVADSGEGHTRPSLRSYSLPFLDHLLAPLGALAILAYALYTLDEETVGKHGPFLMFTVPFVVFGVVRYLWLVLEAGRGSEPTRVLLGDRQLVLAGIGWLLVVLATIVPGAGG